MSRAAAVSNERLRSKNELRASRTAGWELERKRFERLPFSILEPSRPALCETISAVDGPRGVRLKRNLRGLATVRAHRIIHLTRATVVAASSAASVFVHSLPTIRTLVGTDGRLTGPILIKGAHPARTPEIDGNGVLQADGGSEGRDGGTLSDKLSAEVVFGARIVGIDGGGQPPRRVQGSTGTHVFVDLAGAPAPILVVPEVHVVVTAHRLRAESTADLHASEKELPLLKGNFRVDESVLC